MLIKLKCENCKSPGVILEVEGEPDFRAGYPTSRLRHFTCEACGHATRVTPWPAAVGGQRVTR